MSLKSMSDDSLDELVRLRARVKELETALDAQAHEATEVRHRIKRLQTLQTIAAALASKIERDEIVATILEQVAPALGAQTAAVMLLAPDNQNIHLLGQYGISREQAVRFASLPLSIPTVFSDAIRTGLPVFVSNADERDARYPHLSQMRTSNVRAAAGLPLVATGKVIGSLGVTFLEDQYFSHEQGLFLEAVANQCAVALQRAMIYDELRATIQAKDEAFALLDALFTTAPVGLIFMDRDLRYVRVNDVIGQISGVAPEAHYGRSIEEVTPGHAKNVEPLIRSVLETGQPIVNHPFRGVPPVGGDEHEWLISYYPVGTPSIGVGIIVVDVTEVAQVTTALRRMEQNLVTLLDILPVGVSILNKQREVIYANQELERILSLSREQLITMSYKQRNYLFSDGSPMPPEAFASSRALHEQRAVYNVETGVVREDGPVVWTSANAMPVASDDWAVVITTTDITAHKQSELRLQEQAATLREQARQLEYAHVVVRDADDRIIYWTKGMQTLYGWTQEEAIGKITHALFQTLFPVSFEAYKQELFANGFWQGELVHMRRDGTQLVVASHHVLYQDIPGAPVRILEVNNDVTALKRAEAELRRRNVEIQRLSHRLVEAHEHERRLLAHELHDELGQQLTALNMMLEIGSGTPPEAVQSQIQKAQRVATDLTSQVRHMSLDLRPVMLDDFGLLETLYWYFRRYTERTQVVVDFKHIDFPASLSSTLAAAIYRIVQEALTNVARYADVKQANVRIWERNGIVMVTIEDTGRGFDLESTLRKGRSVGLSGMRERVLLLGGHLVIDSAPNEGTRILVTLPLTEDQSSKQAYQ